MTDATSSPTHRTGRLTASPPPGDGPSLDAALGGPPATCPACGYDLAARPPGAPCSECGLDLPEGTLAIPGWLGSGPATWIGVVFGFFGAMQVLSFVDRASSGEWVMAAMSAGAAVVFGWLFSNWWRDRRAHRDGRGGDAWLVVRPGSLAWSLNGRERWRLAADAIAGIELVGGPTGGMLCRVRRRERRSVAAFLRDPFRRHAAGGLLAFPWSLAGTRRIGAALRERLGDVRIAPAPAASPAPSPPADPV